MTFEEHESLLRLEQAVFKDIEEYVKTDAENFTRSQKLESSVHDTLAKIRALMRDLELLVEEVDTDEDRQQVARLLTGHTAEYNRIQQAFKEAAVQRRHKTTLTAMQERQELLGSAEGGLKRRQMQTDADVVAASQGITESLRRTRQIMAEELAHTSATLAAMEVSHGQLNKTKDEYVGQHSLLKRSKGLLRTITWQNKSETLLLWGGLILFALVAAYVAQKRAMYFVPESLRPMALVRTAVWVVKGGKGHGRPQPPPPPPPPPKGRLAPANGLETPSVGRNGEINVSADGVGQPKEAKMERRAGLEGMASETAGSNQQAKPSDSGAVSSGSGLPERIQDEPQKKIEL